MTTDTIARLIQLILAPVVMVSAWMVSACAILVSGALSHYAAINDRLRALARERLELLRGPTGKLRMPAASEDAFTTKRLQEIDDQLPGLAHRLDLVHSALVAVYGAILVLVLSMFVIAFAALDSSSPLATAALVIFLLGTAIMLVGIVLVAIEIGQSNGTIQYEVRRVMRLGR